MSTKMKFHITLLVFLYVLCCHITYFFTMIPMINIAITFIISLITVERFIDDTNSSGKEKRSKKRAILGRKYISAEAQHKLISRAKPWQIITTVVIALYVFINFFIGVAFLGYEQPKEIDGKYYAIRHSTCREIPYDDFKKMAQAKGRFVSGHFLIFIWFPVVYYGQECRDEAGKKRS